MDFNTFLTEEVITEKILDAKLKQFNDAVKMFYSPELVKFIKVLSNQTGIDLDKQYTALKESMYDFIYEVDSSGFALTKKE